jgi:hypothetical protein
VFCHFFASLYDAGFDVSAESSDIVMPAKGWSSGLTHSRLNHRIVLVKAAIYDDRNDEWAR